MGGAAPWIDPGTTGGICVGTPAECAARLKTQLDAAPEGLDIQIQFDLDSAELTAQARDQLSELALAMNEGSLAADSFVIEGHTDARGTKAHNDALSLRRAKAVEAYLTQGGVDAARLQAMGLGESAPRTPDPYDAANRRVELRIKDR
jgi:outer membrane protein OmpA-like peptidoglycan-associated protein